MGDNSLIGVFDSGIGGLTVLEQLVKIFPRENFMYIADQGHCPYGTKTPEEIGDRVEKITRYFLSQRVKAIVIACNTASVRIARARAVTDIPVISVIDPTCAKAVSVTKNKKIAVLATQSTINSGVYQNMLTERGVVPVPLACGEFVDYLENGDGVSGEKIVREKLTQIKDAGMDTLIHGCTHFSLLESYMKKVLGNINYVACGQPTGEYLKNILEEKNLLTDNTGSGTVDIYTTGDASHAKKTTGWFKPAHNPIKRVVID